MRKALRIAHAGLLVLCGLVVALLVWGVAVEPRLIVDVEREQAEIPALPAQWTNQKVAVIADLQVGMFLDNTSTIEEIVSRIIDERPAAVLIAGDFVYLEGVRPLQAHLEKLKSLLRPLRAANIPTYAVLGNHDYAQLKLSQPPNARAADEVTAALESIGIRVLRNESLRLSMGDGGPPLYLVGIGPEWPGHAKPQEALSGVPHGAPRIVLMHNPDTMEQLPPHSAPLAVAGHTHGGQVRLPFAPKWTWLTYVWKDQVHADGWIRGLGAPGNDLYVNRGIGFSMAPLRINAPPELTIFTLQRPG